MKDDVAGIICCLPGPICPLLSFALNAATGAAAEPPRDTRSPGADEPALDITSAPDGPDRRDESPPRRRGDRTFWVAATTRRHAFLEFLSVFKETKEDMLGTLNAGFGASISSSSSAAAAASSAAPNKARAAPS